MIESNNIKLSFTNFNNNNNNNNNDNNNNNNNEKFIPGGGNYIQLHKIVFVRKEGKKFIHVICIAWRYYDVK